MTNKNTLANTAAVALTGVALAVSSASAQNLLGTQQDDLFVGIRATGGVGATKDVLIDIGQAGTFRDASANVVLTLNIGNLNQDLTDVFGAGWNTRSDLVWGVFGTPGTTAGYGDAAKVLYASASAVGGTPYVGGGVAASSWKGNSPSAQGSAAGKMLAVEQAYVAIGGTPNLSTTNSQVTLVQNVSDVNSYATYNTITGVNPGGISFGLYNPTIEAQLGNDLDLFRMAAVYNQPGTFVGTFSIASDATITYEPVPEPSSIAMTCVGALLAWGSRRKTKNA